MNKHEYMIWRAATRYNLLHNESIDVTEENIEEMINEKEKKIIELIPNYFEGKTNHDESRQDLEERGECLNKFGSLRRTHNFILSRDDSIKWNEIELLCYLESSSSNNFHPPYSWCRYPVVSYNEAIQIIYDYDFGNRFVKPNFDDIQSIKKWLPQVGLYTRNQADIISMLHKAHYQITPSGEKVVTHLLLGDDFLKEIGNRGDRHEPT